MKALKKSLSNFKLPRAAKVVEKKKPERNNVSRPSGLPVNWERNYISAL